MYSELSEATARTRPTALLRHLSSTEWKLLSRVAAYPVLAPEIDVSLIDMSLEESQTLSHISASYQGNRGDVEVSNAMMIEQFKDSPHAEMLFYAQAFGLELKETEDQARHYVRLTISSLEMAKKKREIKSLEERLQKGLLSKDEHHQYAKMISEVETLKQRIQADARKVAQ